MTYPEMINAAISRLVEKNCAAAAIAARSAGARTTADQRDPLRRGEPDRSQRSTVPGVSS